MRSADVAGSSGTTACELSLPALAHAVVRDICDGGAAERRRSRHQSAGDSTPHLTETSHWYGNRPTQPDYLPVIGPAPNHRNVVLAFGHQHLGLSLAAITAELVTDIVQGHTPRFDITALSARRFGS